MYRQEQVVFIEIPEFTDSSYAEECRQKTEAEGRQFVKLEGSIDLIKKLIFGEWNEEEFLVLRQNESIVGVYDLDEVVRAVHKDCITKRST